MPIRRGWGWIVSRHDRSGDPGRLVCRGLAWMIVAAHRAGPMRSMPVQERAIAGVDGFDSAEFGQRVFLVLCVFASAISSGAPLSNPGELFRIGRLGPCAALWFVIVFGG